MNRWLGRAAAILLAVFLSLVFGPTGLSAPPQTQPASNHFLFARPNLVAWCIVPYDGQHRTPEQRAEMLDRIGIHQFAYDWRAVHLPTFEDELGALAKHGIKLTAVWFPDHLDKNAGFILDLLAKHQIKTQLWVASGISPKGPDDKTIDRAADLIRPVAEEAAKIGCTVGLYNHGGWFGDPEHQIAIIDKLKHEGIDNLGIVYNFHHGHGDIDRFASLFAEMKPYLLAVNINGMIRDGDRIGKGILPVGQGDCELSLLKIVRDGGYQGPIGIINETDKDAEARLLDNIDGLDWLAPQLDGAAPGPAPEPRTYLAPATESAGPTTKPDYWTVEDPKDREKFPLFQTTPAANGENLTPGNGWPDAAEYGDWYRSHGNDACTRYSPLAQLTPENVKSLKLAWTYHSKDGRGNIQCNPVVVDGVMYVPTVGNCVVAIDAETGGELWRFKCIGQPAHRGLTYYKGTNGVSSRVLVTAGTGLWALDPQSGKPIDSFGDHGRVTISECVVAPAVFQNVIVLAGWNRDVFGYDLTSGKPLWTFHTIPQPGEPYTDTWDKEEQGANDWGGMALDASRGIAYVTTGSPKPNFVGVGHLGNNLYGNCVIALDATTGQRLWHFQEIRHDIWDLDVPAPPILVTVEHDGKKVDAVAAVTKIGNTLLLDRVTGQPLFPFRRRRAPASTLRGERTALYQPDVEMPEPFARKAFTLDDVTDISPQARAFILGKLSDAKMGWFESYDEGKPLAQYGLHGGAEWTGAAFDPASGMLYVTSNELPWMISVRRSERPAVDETKLPSTPGRHVYELNCMPCHGPSREGVAVAPSLLGLTQRLKDNDVLELLKTGRNGMPAAPQLTDADKKVLLEYLFDRDRHYDKPTKRPERPAYSFGGYPKLLDQDNYPGCKPPWGQLNAIDLNTGKIAWQVPLGEYDELTKRGVPKTGTENFGGAIVTGGGLVFCGGTRDIKIRAFDKKTGQELWSHPLPFGGFAPPATYFVHGKQYVVIPATGGGKLGTPTGDAYVAFCLP